MDCRSSRSHAPHEAIYGPAGTRTGTLTNDSVDGHLRLRTTEKSTLPAEDYVILSIPHRATCAESRRPYPAAMPDSLALTYRGERVPVGERLKSIEQAKNGGLFRMQVLSVRPDSGGLRGHVIG